jgi:hypothetical protein
MGMGGCETCSDAMRIDFDSVWKDTTEVYFTALLELFEPQTLPKVPDHEPLSFLDQEMQQLAQVLGDEGGPRSMWGWVPIQAVIRTMGESQAKAAASGGGRGGRRDCA